MYTLRDHQNKAIELLAQSLKSGHKRPILNMPTGSGKTLTAAQIIKQATDKGNRVIFTVPRISLVDQTAEKFRQHGIRDIGIIQGNHPATNKLAQVQIASVQTLQRRRWIPEADLVIMDERHLHFKFYEKWIQQWNNVPFIGLSATPWTKGLGKWHDDLIVPITTQELIDLNYLSDFEVYAPSAPDLKGVKVQAGDYKSDELSKRSQADYLVADIVQTWKRLADGLPTLCFCVDRAHAKRVQAEFEGSGVPTGYVDCYTPLEQRSRLSEEFHSGEIKVITNCDVLATGVDWDVRAIILARATRSEMRHVQTIGRALRTADGKHRAILLDHSTNHERLGFVTDIVYHELDDGEPKKRGPQEKKEDLPKKCPSCHFMKPPKVHECPQCGFKPQKQSTVQPKSGNLVKLTRTMTDKKQLYGELQYIALERGYSKGWCAHAYRSATGKWPKGVKEQVCEPTESTRRFVDKMIADYVKRVRA